MTCRIVTAGAFGALLAGSLSMTPLWAQDARAEAEADAAPAAGAEQTVAPNSEGAEPAMPAGDVIRVGIAEVSDTDGSSLGDVRVEETASGQVLVSIALEGLPAGPHGVHIHEIGDCSAEDFSSAEGHLAGGAEHGVMVEGGPHPGDLPNISVGEDGTATFDVFKADLTFDLMDDADGAAFIVHDGPDDYVSQPSGDAGDRIACGTFEFRTE